MESDRTPKGKLLLIGGHEEKGLPGESLNILMREKKQSHFEILGKLICQASRDCHRIEIIAAASTIPQEMEKLYVEAYKKAGFTDVSVMHFQSPDDPADPAHIERVKAAHAIFFTGGDQLRLVSILRNSPFIEAIREKYMEDEDFILAGTSAGAMAMPEMIIDRGAISEAILKGDVVMGPGFGFLKNVIVDTHFIVRGRFARLANAVLLNRSCIGLGMGEDTALFISKGDEAECIGSGMVIVIDATAVKSTNADEADQYTPIVAEDLKVHILAEGSKFSLKKRIPV